MYKPRDARTQYESVQARIDEYKCIPPDDKHYQERRNCRYAGANEP